MGMAQFDVNIIESRKLIEDERKYSKELKDLKSQIKDISNNLSFEVSSKRNIKYRLNNLVTNIGNNVESMQSLTSVLIDVLNKYEQTENKILNQNVKLNTGKLMGDELKKILSYFTGGLSSITWDSIESIKGNTYVSWSSVSTISKDFSSLIKSIAKDPSADWKEVFSKFVQLGKTNEELGKIINSNISSIGKLNEGFMEGVSNSITGPAVIASGLVNGICNYADYKAGKMTGGRAVAETISETAIDVLKTAAITGAITAVCAVAGFAAPVAVIGLGAVVVSTAADTICKWATSKYLGEAKGVTEFVSDWILDNGENIVKSVKDGVSAKWNQIVNWVSGKSSSGGGVIQGAW
jgi:hypothetical protein